MIRNDFLALDETCSTANHIGFGDGVGPGLGHSELKSFRLEM